MAQRLLIPLTPVASPADRPALCIEHHGGHGNLTGAPHGVGTPQQALHPKGLLAGGQNGIGH